MQLLTAFLQKNRETELKDGPARSSSVQFSPTRYNSAWLELPSAWASERSPARLPSQTRLELQIIQCSSARLGSALECNASSFRTICIQEKADFGFGWHCKSSSAKRMLDGHAHSLMNLRSQSVRQSVSQPVSQEGKQACSHGIFQLRDPFYLKSNGTVGPTY